jgi:D-alanyl-D-alanine carboxypeptidase
MSKAFNGAVALSLVADKTLSLDDTVGKWLPTLPKAWKKVSLAQALQHTSGIPDYAGKKWTDAISAAPLDPPASPAELLSFVPTTKLAFEPGSEYRYSSSDNVVVALMVEAATGRPYEDLLQERVYGPLGLTGTTLPRDSTMPLPYLHGYTVNPPTPPEDLSEGLAGGWSWASGGIVSTSSDVNTFMRGYATGATTNKATARNQFRFVVGGSEPPGPGKNEAGLGIFRYQTRCGTVYGHTGNLPGYTSFVAATRDGSRSTTVAVNALITPTSAKARFVELRRIFELATCAALAGT